MFDKTKREVSLEHSQRKVLAYRLIIIYKGALMPHLAL